VVSFRCTDVTITAASVDHQPEDEVLIASESDGTTSKSDEPSVQCLATDLLSVWQSLKVRVF